MMKVPSFILLAVAAFCLGACPFSLWVGRHLLGKDIRDYGDGNPGAVNVFRVGGRKAGSLALTLDIAKGTPFVLLSHILCAFRNSSCGSRSERHIGKRLLPTAAL